MKPCLILTGGKFDIAFARLYLKGKHYDKVIAVDAGLMAAKELGIMPDYIVGDFDTLDQEVAREYRQYPYIIWEVHQAEKNETDTELAVNRAAAIGCTELTILGATGGRMDHMLGNLQLLYSCLQRGIHACMADRQNKIYLIDRSHTFYADRIWGKYISFLPFSEYVEGITLKGFRYPLENRDISLGYEVGLCISNELTEAVGEICISDGVLICVESCD